MAHAQEPIQSQGDFYLGAASLSIKAAATYLEMDIANGLSTSIDDLGTGDFIRRPDDGFGFSDWGFSAALEAAIPAPLPFVGADAVVVGLDGEWVSGSGTFRVDLGANESFDVLEIDGTNTSNILAGPTETVTGGAEADYGRYSGFLGARWLVLDDGHITFGLYSSFSQIDLSSHFQDTSDPTEFATLDEEVRTYSIGPQITAEQSIEVTDRLQLFGRVSGALLYARGDLDARQVWGDPASQFRVQDDQSNVAALLSASGGFNFKPILSENVVVSFVGGIEWRNDVYAIANPELSPGQQAGTGQLAPVSLKQTDALSATVGARVTFRFN
jgi:hypothetical protein